MAVTPVRPLDKRLRQRLPQLRRVLLAYEAGTPVEDLAFTERESPRMVYYLLSVARRLRQQGRL